MVGKLVFRSIRHESTRLVSAMLGVAAAVGLLSWHLGLAYTAISSGHDASVKAAAPFSAWITPAPAGLRMVNEAAVSKTAKKAEKPEIRRGRDRATAEATGGRRFAPRGGSAVVPAELLQVLKSSEIVDEVMPLLTLNVVMDMRPGGRVLQGPPFTGMLCELPKGGIPFACGEVEGRLPDQNSQELEVIANSQLFGSRVPKPELGSVVPFVLANGTVSAKIVGFFDMSKLVLAFPSLYVNEAAMRKINAMSAVSRPSTLNPQQLPNSSSAHLPKSPEAHLPRPPSAHLPKSPEAPRATLVLVRTKAGVNPADIGFIMDGVPEADNCTLYTVDAVADRFRSDTIKNLMAQMPMSLTLAVITSSCLLTTVLMIGLALRRRRIAELRCAGMTRGGVARLVFSETGVILVPGWILGLCGAALFLQLFLLSEKASAEMPSVIHLGWQTPVYSAILALVVGMCAVILPVISSMRVKPLEITGADITEARPVSWWKTLLAVLLLLPLPLIAMDLDISGKVKSMLMLCVGLPGFIASLCLGMHPLMRLVEFVFLRPLGWMLGLNPQILHRRLSRDPARAAGTVLTLALGLGGFMAIHIWGGTLMSSFVPSPEWPDAIISALPTGFTDEQVDAVRGCKGIADGRALKLECTQFPMKLNADSDETVGNGVLLLFGADPEAAFGGDNPLAPMKFVEGNRIEAARLMSQGNYCVIPKMLSNLAGIHKGDKFFVAGEYLEVAGVLDLNWHMVTSRANVRTRFGGKTTMPRRGEKGAGGGMPMRTIGMAFTSERFVRQLTGNEDKTYFMWLNMSEELRKLNGLQSTVRLDEEVHAVVNDNSSNAIRVHHRDEISDGTLAHGNDILGTMARIPFWSLVVTSTGIAVLLVASVRGSKREFEVMRAIGMTRGQLSRLILGEALLVTICALILSMISGILIGWSFTGLSTWLMTAGLDVKLIIPWMTIGKGMLFAFALCVIMALLPLARVVRLADE